MRESHIACVAHFVCLVLPDKIHAVRPPPLHYLLPFRESGMRVVAHAQCEPQGLLPGEWCHLRARPVHILDQSVQIPILQTRWELVRSQEEPRNM